VTGQHYISQAAVPPRAEEKYHDYGYFATFLGPSGNQIVVIAGTRDEALMHTAEAVTQPRSLDALAASAHGASAFEALYDVYGMDRMNLDGKLLITSRLNTSRIWTGEPGSATVAPVSGGAASSAAAHAGARQPIHSARAAQATAR
jgi:hypothetical protein